MDVGARPCLPHQRFLVRLSEDWRDHADRIVWILNLDFCCWGWGGGDSLLVTNLSLSLVYLLNSGIRIFSYIPRSVIWIHRSLRIIIYNSYFYFITGPIAIALSFQILNEGLVVVFISAGSSWPPSLLLLLSLSLLQFPKATISLLLGNRSSFFLFDFFFF